MLTRRRSRLVAGITLGLVLLGSGLVSGVSQRLTLGQLARGATGIIVGKVSRVSDGYRVHWPGTGNLIAHDVTIEVGERWKGNGANDGDGVVLQVPGGTLADGTRMVVSEAPRFAQGERVLVFTEMAHERLSVYSWEQGKYTIVGRRVVSKPASAIAEDILTEPLRRKVAQLLADEKDE